MTRRRRDANGAWVSCIVHFEFLHAAEATLLEALRLRVFALLEQPTGLLARGCTAGLASSGARRAIAGTTMNLDRCFYRVV